MSKPTKRKRIPKPTVDSLANMISHLRQEMFDMHERAMETQVSLANKILRQGQDNALDLLHEISSIGVDNPSISELRYLYRSAVEAGRYRK